MTRPTQQGATIRRSRARAVLGAAARRGIERPGKIVAPADGGGLAADVAIAAKAADAAIEVVGVHVERFAGGAVPVSLRAGPRPWTWGLTIAAR